MPVPYCTMRTGAGRLCLAIAAWLSVYGQGAPEIDHARTLIVQGRFDEAIALLDHSSRTPPPQVEALLGKAYYRKRTLAPAIAHLTNAVREDPRDRESAQLLALALYSTRMYQSAIPVLETFVSRAPAESFDAAYVLGMCYLKTGQIEKARKAFADMYSVSCDSATAHLLLAQMMVRQRQEDQARPEIEKAIGLDPRLPMAHFLLGEIYLYQSSVEAALSEFRKELAISPTVSLVYWRAGDAFSRLDRYDEAVRALKQAIWLNEAFSAPYVLLGQIALKKGDLELALGFLERAVKMDPNNSKARYSLARAYERAGHPDRAREQMELVRSVLRDRASNEATTDTR
jgi:tetratricopeptide (TPR) repeat protein